MHAEDLVVDDGRQAKIVEDVGAIPPHVHRPVLSRCQDVVAGSDRVGAV